jgi:hypothetical protein
LGCEDFATERSNSISDLEVDWELGAIFFKNG